MTPEQIEALLVRVEDCHKATFEEDACKKLAVVRDLALKGLQAEAMREERDMWKARAEYYLEAKNDSESSREAMREAIRRAIIRLACYNGDGATITSLRADLEQALNERKET
jgi:hypothetical protein